MFRKSSIPVVALAALLAVSLAHAQGSTSGTASGTASATASTPGKAPVKASATKTAKHHYAKIDINAASKEDLMKLPGVGDATAEKIIAARPFKSKSELVSKGIVTKKEYASIAMKVIAKQEPTANASSK